jgi:predicted dehydrogenase
MRGKIMSFNRVRWGILGTSFISEVMAQAIEESSNSQLLAIGSRLSSSGTLFANKFSISKLYTDYSALLNDSEIDAIYIGLPNHLHKEWIIRCAQAGKHIVCEKPLVISVKEAEEVFSVLEKTNVFCMEALMYRYHPLTKKLQELINDKIIGDIKLFNAIYMANIATIANPTAGGSILNLGCYPVSLIRLLANAEPKEIVALGRMNPDIRNDHQASAILKFDNQAIAVVSIADDMEMFWQFDLYGTKGTLKMITNPWLPDRNNKIIIQYHAEEKAIEINVTAEKPLYTYQIDAMSNKILGNVLTQNNEISWQDSLGNIKALDQWLRQLRT